MDRTSLRSFPADWFSELDSGTGHFNLFGDEGRFYQFSDAQRHRAATDLLQEIPTGNNFWHFRHSTDEEDGLCPACCALGLLRLPLFSVSGLPDLKAGINGSPPIYAVPWGATLLETLLANWIPANNVGVPAWVQPGLAPGGARDVPLLTGFTLLSRRVWLHDPCEPSGECIGCGRWQAALVRACEFQSAGRLENEQWSDPHLIYLDGKPRKPSRAMDLTAAGKFRMDRPWPELVARLLETHTFGCGEKPVSVLVVGFATDKAKNVDVWERTIRLSPAARETAVPSVRQWYKGGARTDSRSPAGGAKHVRKHVEIPPTLYAIRPHIESQVSMNVGELLVGGDDAWQQAAGEYRPLMEIVAKSLSPGYTTAALSRRREIGVVTPDMRPKTETAKRSSRKKGGGK